MSAQLHAVPDLPSDGTVAPDDTVIVLSRTNIRITGKGGGQKPLIAALKSHAQVVTAVGPFGAGKTYLAIACALECLDAGIFNEIILSRAVVATEALGFLPGDKDRKVEPYLQPLFDILAEFGVQVETNNVRPLRGQTLPNRHIRVEPLAYMRGKTFSKACLILDEAQNCSKDQLALFISRAGEGSRVFICASTEQCDLPKGKSGLEEHLEVMALMGCPVITLTAEDIQRSGFVREYYEALLKVRTRRASLGYKVATFLKKLMFWKASPW